MSSIRLSEKHGVNPSVMVCPCCGKDTGVALHGRLPNDLKAPRHTRDREPCESCQSEFEGYRQKGFVIYVISDDYDAYCEELSRKYKPVYPTPWQFFQELHVVTREAAERMFTGADLTMGACFMSLSTARQIGLEQPGTGEYEG